ncbi:MAG: L,D-transpeptidase family protein, partial [Acidobacteriota bacterium]
MSKKRQRILLFSGGSLLAALMTLAIPLDTPPPPEQSRQIRQILARARSEGADLWAPRAFQAANQGEMAARQALYSQQRRPPLLRRYAQARSTARNALNLAQTALGEALKNRARARQEAVVGLDRAAEELDSARTRARAVKISADGRTAIKRLEISLSEARRSLAREAFKIAASQASQVEENSRVWLGRSRQLADRLNDTERLARWRRWSAETVEWSAARHAPAIVVDKAQRRLFLYEGGALVETFETDLGLNPLADKATEGDNATPEGKYRVTVIKAPGETRFHRALLLDYVAAGRSASRER